MKTGQKAPSFSLTDRNGKTCTLSDIKGDYAVVYFYPKDNTPGCTIEAIQFNQQLADFKKLKTTVIGISGGDEKSKTTFCNKHDLNLLLLSDPDFATAKAFGSYGEKSFMGRTFNGILRNPYVLDRERKIIKIYDKVKPESHPGEVLEFIRALGKSAAPAKRAAVVKKEKTKPAAVAKKRPAAKAARRTAK